MNRVVQQAFPCNVSHNLMGRLSSRSSLPKRSGRSLCLSLCSLLTSVKQFRLVSAITVFMTGVTVWLLPQYGLAQQPVKLIHADSLVGYTKGGDAFRELIGHVQMQQDSTTLSCDRALQNLTTDSVNLYGDVRVLDDTLTLKTNRANYSGKTKTVTSNTPVYLNDRKRTLTARSGTYDAETKVAKFYGNVFVRDTSSWLRSDTLFYYRAADSTIANGNVKIHSLDNNVTVSALSRGSRDNNRLRLRSRPISCLSYRR